MVKLSRKILNLELSEGVPDLPAYPGYGGLFIVFWWHGIPLGQRELSADQLPIPASQLAILVAKAISPAVGCHLLEHGFKGKLPIPHRFSPTDHPPQLEALVALTDPLRHLQAQLHQDQAINRTVSVVICTRDRPEQLAICLQSLQQLTQTPHEILIVDNAPKSDATQQLVHQLMPQIAGLKYVLESSPGLSNARNTGIAHSTGEIIAFTDDDVVVNPDWTLRLQQNFQAANVMAVTGLMLPAELETTAQFLFQRSYGGPEWGYQPLVFNSQFFEASKHRGVPVWRIGAGANMAFRRQIFDLVGNFDQRLGAGASGCSEDSELWYRVLAEGWLCRYDPTAVVFHFHRKDMEELQQQMYHYMRGHVAALLIQFERYRHWGNLRRLFIGLPQWYSRLLWRGLRNRFRDRYRSLFAEISGCLAGIQFYLEYRNTNV